MPAVPVIPAGPDGPDGPVDRPVDVAVSGYAGPVHVRDEGPRDGPVLLLLHGFSGSLAWFDAVVPLLADDFRIVRVDLLGHGETGGVAADAPVQARAVEAVLAALDVVNVTAVGHSFGADVAVELTEFSPRVRRLIIVTQAPDYSDANLPRGNRIMTLPVLGTALHWAAKRLFSVLVSTRRGPVSDRALAQRALRDFRALHSAMFRVILIDRRNRMTARPLDEQVRAAGKPTLVILGERDHFYGARSAARYAAAGAEIEILPDAGHSPFVEHPRQAADLIRRFTDEPCPRSVPS